MVRVLNPFDGDIDNETITSWLDQFKPEEHTLIKKLLSNFRYYSYRKVNCLLRTLHLKIQETLHLSTDKIWYVPVGYVAKSGSAVAYFFKKQNNVPQNRFISLRDLKSVHLTKETAVVFLDDFIGSGHQAIQVWKTILEPDLPAVLPCPIVFGALVGFKKGIRHLENNSGLKAIVTEIISETDLPFSKQSKIFSNEKERQKAKVILQKYGKILYPRYPLGYAASQGLLGFFYSTPNNTFPIFWATEAKWHPLLPHGESFRDPDHLIGPPLGLERGIASESPERPIIESNELDKYDIPPEMAINIFSEFHSSQFFLVLAPILRSLKIDNSTFSELLNLIRELKYAEHEKEPVCSSLLIIGDKCDSDFNEDIFVGATPDLTLANTSEVISFAQLIDGFTGAVVIKPNGEVLGNCLFKPVDEYIDVFLPERYHKAARASITTHGLIFLFNGNGRVSVFQKGIRILSRRGASWHLQTDQINRGIESLANDHSLDARVLQGVLKLSYRMSDEGKGALITVGDHKHVLKICDPPKTKHFRWLPMNIISTNDETMIGLISQDGATIVAKDGSIIQGMTFLRPPPGTEGEVEVGRGSKHSTAAKVSSITNAICIAVSVDGRITVYSNGRMAFKMMG